MTDYNDGNWHGWNGGECPVHPQSLVQGMYLCDGDPAPEGLVIDDAAEFNWHKVGKKDLIAFRVVKPYTEPLEGYAVTLFRSAREAKTAHPGCDPVFVREVKE